MYIWSNKYAYNNNSILFSKVKRSIQINSPKLNKIDSIQINKHNVLLTCDNINLYVFTPNTKLIQIYNIENKKLIVKEKILNVNNIKFDSLYVYILHNNVIGIYFKKCLNRLKTINCPGQTSLRIDKNRIITNGSSNIKIYNTPSVISNTEKKLIMESNVQRFRELLVHFLDDAPKINNLNKSNWDIDRYKLDFLKIKIKNNLTEWTTNDLIKYFQYNHTTQRFILNYNINGKVLLDLCRKKKILSEKIHKEFCSVKRIFYCDSDNSAKNNICSICKEKINLTIFNPCGHKSVCANCYYLLQNRCPICRSEVDSVILD